MATIQVQMDRTPQSELHLTEGLTQPKLLLMAQITAMLICKALQPLISLVYGSAGRLDRFSQIRFGMTSPPPLTWRRVTRESASSLRLREGADLAFSLHLVISEPTCLLSS